MSPRRPAPAALLLVVAAACGGAPPVSTGTCGPVDPSIGVATRDSSGVDIVENLKVTASGASSVRVTSREHKKHKSPLEVIGNKFVDLIPGAGNASKVAAVHTYMTDSYQWIMHFRTVPEEGKGPGIHRCFFPNATGGCGQKALAGDVLDFLCRTRPSGTTVKECSYERDEPGGFDITPWADRVQLVDARYDGTWELPALGAVTAPTAVLVRPDGYMAWVRYASCHSGDPAATH